MKSEGAKKEPTKGRGSARNRVIEQEMERQEGRAAANLIGHGEGRIVDWHASNGMDQEKGRRGHEPKVCGKRGGQEDSHCWVQGGVVPQASSPEGTGRHERAPTKRHTLQRQDGSPGEGQAIRTLGKRRRNRKNKNEGR